MCASNELSIDTLREKIHQCEKSFDNNNIDITVAVAVAVAGSSFFHQACLHEKVTLEIIECLLSSFPNAAENLGACSFLGFDDEYYESEAPPLHYCA